jgi:dipeptidyl aminopeptidase/acylaminoacyl peptidase
MTTTTPLIPRKTLFGNPDKASLTISPDASRIAFLAPLKGVLNVWVGPAGDPDTAKPVTKDAKRGIRQFFWAFTNRHILYVQDKNGDENWHVYAVDLTTRTILDLTPIKGVNAQVEGVSHKHPSEIIVGLNDRNPQLHDVYRVNIETGERSLMLQNDGFVGFMLDDDYTIRSGMRMMPDGSGEILERTPDGYWTDFLLIPADDLMTTQPLDFDKSGKFMYMIDSRKRNTAALVRMSLATKRTTLLAEDPDADIDGAMVHPTEHTVQAARSNYERTRWQVLDPAVQADFDALAKVADGEMSVISRSLDDRRWAVAFVMDDGPVRYYLWDRDTKTARFVFTNRQELEGVPLSKLRPVVIPSRDGLKLVSYLTLPPEVKTRKPAEPLPMVLYVHGGPWWRDSWGFNTIHQWLANRGFAVLSVNFRGSTGFGKAFINAANREWGGKMHDDLIDAVKWAIKRKVADPKRVVIMGGSYGGYSTLVGMTFTPEVFAAGVDIVGVSNLLTFMKTIPPYWAPMMAMMKLRVGDDSTEEGREFLRSRSPITYVDRICRPLLIGQGANDPRVNQAESDQIVEAMRKKHTPVTYVLYPDEGHGFARPANNLSFFAVTEAFLAHHIGTRCEPIGEDFEGSSIQVPAGASDIKGLEAALKRAEGT